MNVPIKCLGCGLVLRHGDVNGQPPRTLCDDCKRFAKLARYGTRCPECRSEDVVYTTESTGLETLFCSVCEYIWMRWPASMQNASGVITTAARFWRGVERRFSDSRRLDSARSRRAS
jgi:Zn ribbon nucleic-acid-binding protein